MGLLVLGLLALAAAACFVDAARVSRRWHARGQAAVAARLARCVPQQPTSAAPPVLVGTKRVVVAGCPRPLATTTPHPAAS